MHKLLRELLHELCDELRDCASGEEAIQICGGYRPDLVTMHLQLKDMDGIAAMRVIRSLYPACHQVVVTH
jgi:CheY-like chemotaxis protein